MSQATRCLLGGLFVLCAPIALLAVPPSDTVMVIGPGASGTPDLARIVAEAGGSILGLGGRPNIVIARADTDGFVRRLYGAGARLVLDGRLARLCGRPSQSANPAPRSGPSLGRAAP